jgi:hypothetical protein
VRNSPSIKTNLPLVKYGAKASPRFPQKTKL